MCSSHNLTCSFILHNAKIKKTQNIQKTHIYSAISVNIKKEICEYILANTNIKQANVALYFNTKYSELNIDRTAVNKIWKNCKKWLAILPNLQTSHTFC